jgi:hypothetical protein
MYKSNSNSVSFGRSLEGDELWVCHDTETEFQVGLTRVKAKTLSRIGSRSRVRSGPGRVRQVKAKSLSGAVRLSWDRLAQPSGLAGLSSGKAKILSRAGFSLIP